ncbi:MAG: efflux RND transporter permease subunit [Bryobacterales bacterium]|nr:efflux RND transporter permease subunit [Bryobacterales bacterium]
MLHPVTILLSLPLAVPFGFLSLWLFNETLNLYSALGILVLFGVVKKNSILQIDPHQQPPPRRPPRLQVILQANPRPPRPHLDDHRHPRRKRCSPSPWAPAPARRSAAPSPSSSSAASRSPCC